jgi:hypothetical protein
VSLTGFLVDALRRCVRGGRELGARAVVVDAINEDAMTFYRQCGSHELDERRLMASHHRYRASARRLSCRSPSVLAR